MNYLEKLNLNRVTEDRVRRTKSVKERVLTSIKNEIKLIEEREDLTLKKLTKTIDGKKTEVNENRFWKPSNKSKNNILFNIKVKGKIFGFGNEVDRYNTSYFECKNDKNVLIKELESLSEKMNTIDENDTNFWFIGKKPKNEETVEKV